MGDTVGMRISAKADYAVRAMTEIATHEDGPVKAEEVAVAQDIPLNFLLGILRELRQGQLLRSLRGRDGGYTLSRPAAEISLADVIRAVDGPLANVRDLSLSELAYQGSAEGLVEVWMAVRAALRSVLDQVTLEQLASGQLPAHVRELAAEYADSRR